MTGQFYNNNNNNDNDGRPSITHVSNTGMCTRHGITQSESRRKEVESCQTVVYKSGKCSLVNTGNQIQEEVRNVTMKMEELRSFDPSNTVAHLRRTESAAMPLRESDQCPRQLNYL